jgi:DNA polymerase-1
VKVLIFDIEADNLLLDAQRLWCAVTKDLHTGEITKFTPENIHEITDHLRTADRLVAHNGVGYDCPVLSRLLRCDDLPPCIDTLLISRLVYPDRKNNPIGGHSLQAWGKFLRCYKGDHKDFSQFSQEMLDYCVQDVEVTHKVYNYLLPYAKKMPEAVKLEHRVAHIINKQIQNGFTLHKENHESLTRRLQLDRAELLDQLSHIPPFVDHKEMKKRWWVDMAGNKYATKKEAHKEVQKELTQGDPIVKEITTPFNHQSGDHIARLFTERYGWKPKEFSETGKPKTDRKTLAGLKYPEAKVLTRLSVVDKVLGTYALAWEKHARDGKIHGDVITNGAVTGRMTHHTPNLNCPKVVKKDGEVLWGAKGKYGADCRSCFRARDGWSLVGFDASGLELRMLAHYMARWDHGAYGKVILEGDIHTENQKAAGLPSRDNAKTFIYGWLYGAGDAKIGSIVGKGKAEGKRLKEQFLQNLPALGRLMSWVRSEVTTKGHLVGLDGRLLPIRSEHAALNTLLQSAGALVMKKALCIFYEAMEEIHGPHGERWGLCANLHDEIQCECEPEIAELTARLGEDSIRKAGEYFNLSIRLDGEAKIGDTWHSTH